MSNFKNILAAISYFSRDDLRVFDLLIATAPYYVFDNGYGWGSRWDYLFYWNEDEYIYYAYREEFPSYYFTSMWMNQELLDGNAVSAEKWKRLHELWQKLPPAAQAL